MPGGWPSTLRLAVVSAAVAWYAAPAMAEGQRVLDYAYPDQSIWTTRLNAKGEPDNPLLRLADRMFRAAGIAWKSRPLPAARMFEYLRDGDADFSMLVNSSAFAQCCLVSRQPVAGTEMRIYHRKDTPGIAGADDLVGKDVITIRGYSYGGLLGFINDPAHRIVNNVANGHQAAFAMLAAKRADYLVDYAGPATEILADYPGGQMGYDVVSRLNVHLILNRKFPDAEAVMARLEAAAAALRVDGLPAAAPE